MEEQEKIDMREHLINWIDTFLKDGIIPKVVNPNAIKANYIPKQVIRDKIKNIEKQIKGEKANKYTIPECFLILHTLEGILGE